MAVLFGAVLPLLLKAQVAQVVHAPSISGKVDGSVQQMLGEGVTLNGGAEITGDLKVLGTPLVQLNSSPTYGGTLEGSGATSPSNYTITLNSGAKLGHVVRRTNAVSLPAVATVPTPTTSASVTVNAAGQNITWATLKNLTLNSNVGDYSVPAGTYGSFSASSGSGLKLGVAGATQPAVYNFQNLTLNGSSTLNVLGPVVINLANGFSANAPVGASTNPEWLTLNIKAGGFTLNSGCNFYGYLVAPSGTVIVNGGTQLVGGVASAYLTVNGNGLLKLQSAQSANQSPVVALTAPANGSSFTAPAGFTLTATASDADGTVTKVEFFQGTVKIGEDATAPYTFTVSSLGAGTYSYFARASDNAGASSDSAPVSVTVTAANQSPTVSLTAPVGGATFTAPATISLTAAATDPDGSIAHVDFYQGTVQIGQSTTAPYQVTTSTLFAGSYVFSAKAYDNLGAITSSSSVTVTVINPNQAPTVTISSPADGATVGSPGSYNLSATATDSDGSINQVEFFQNGVLVGTDTSAPFQLLVSGLLPGTYDFLARATDNQNLSTDSVAVRVFVVQVNRPPMGTPLSVAATEDTAAAIELTAFDPDGDALSFAILTQPVNGSLVGTPPHLSYQPNANFNGNDSFTFGVTDGLLTSAPTTVSIAVSAVNDAPVALAQTLDSTQGGSVAIVLSGTDVDSPALSYAVVAQPTHGVLSGLLPNLLYTPTPSFSGTDSFSFKISDGESDSLPQIVTINVARVNQAPTAALTSPLAGQVFTSPATFTLHVDAVDADGSVAKVEYYESGIKIGEVTGAPFSLPVSGLGSGSYTYSVKVVDNEGATAVSNQVAISVNAPPTVALTGPNAGATIVIPGAVVVSANASDSDGVITAVEFFDGLQKIGETSSLPYQIQWTVAAAGTHVITARATDNQGGVATSVAITIDVVENQLPNVSFIAPAAGSVFEPGSSILLVASASDPDGAVSKVEFFQGGTKIGEVAAAPYEFLWSVATSGTFSLVARVSDSHGATADSAPITVTVNSAPLANPANAVTAVSTGVAIVLTGSDAETNSASLVFSILQPPSHGSLAGTPPNLTYTPEIAYLGQDQFTFVVSDGTSTSAPATVSISVAEINQPPVVDAGDDVQVIFSPISGPRPRGRIVVNNDEWALTDSGFASSPTAGMFARNLADFLTGGKAGAKFLANTNVLPGSVEFIYTGANLAAAMQAAGHTWIATASAPMTLATLQQYDAVFLGANEVDNQVLIDYIEGGGSVYLSAGSHWSGAQADAEAALWNTFLNHFGLNYEYPYNGIGGTLPVFSDHPLFHGIETLLFANGNSVRRLNYGDPLTQIPFSYNGQGLFGVYGDFANQIFLYGQATDDGRPNPPATVTHAWTQVAGPATAIVEAPTSLTTRVEFTQPGLYTFRLTASDGSATSFDDVTVLADQPPVAFAGLDQILRDTTQPVALAGTATDDGFPSGTIAYSWRKVFGPGDVQFGSPASAETTATFSAPGIYVLELSASDGSRAGVDTVEIRVGMATPEAPPGLVVWWTFNATPLDVGGTHAFGLETPTYITGPVGPALAFDVNNGATAMPHPDFDLGSSANGFTIEYWVQSASGVPMLTWNNGASLYLVDGNRLGGNLRDIDGTDHVFDSYYTFGGNATALWVNSTSWNHIVVSYDKAPGVVRFYENGVLKYSWTVGQIRLASTTTLQLGGNGFTGALDELAFYNRPLSGAEVAVIYTAGGNGKAPPDNNTPPSVDAGPDLKIASSGLAVALVGQVTDDNRPFGAPVVQWSKVEGPGSVTFGNANAASTTATFDAAGIYLLRLTADDGYSPAVSDVVEVRVGGGHLEAPAGLVAWWPANGEPHEMIHGNHDVQLINGASYATGKVLQGFRFNSTGDYGRVPAHADLNLGGYAAGYTIEFWINSGSEGTFLSWAGGASLYLVDGNRVGGNLREAGGAEHPFDSYYSFGGGGANPMWTNAGWTHVAIAYDRANGQAQFFSNGQLRYTWTLGNIDLGTTGDLSFGNGNFTGTLDEVSFYDRALSPAEVAVIYTAGSNGKAPPDNNTPPSVDAGPDLKIASSGLPVAMVGQVTDDNRPFGAPVVQWSKVEGPGSVTFGNANAASTTATFDAAGIYLLKLTADDGYSLAVSDVVEVRVGGHPEAPAGLVAWWPANGEPLEVIHGIHDVQLINGAGYATGEVLQGFRFNGTGDYGRVPAHADLNLGGYAAGYTIEFWINSGSEGTFLSWAGGASLYLVDGNRVGGNLREAGGAEHLFDSYYSFGGGGANPMWTNAGWTHVAIAYDRANGQAQFFSNGQLRYTWTLGNIDLGTTGDLSFGNGNFTGTLDEVSFYDRALSPAEVAVIYTAGSNGKAPPEANTPPSVNAGPDVSGLIGVAVTLQGSAVDDGRPNPPATLTYQWTKVSGPGGVVFSTPGAATTSALFDAVGTYTLRLAVSDFALSSSDELVVTVATLLPPQVSLTSPHDGDTVEANTATTLTASASDADGTVTVVEFFDGTTKLGEDFSAPYSFVVTPGFSAGNHTLTARATDNDGNKATSAPVTITSATPQSHAPSIAIFEPAAGSSLLVNSYFEIAATATDSDGAIVKVEFFQGATKLGEQTLPALGEPNVYFWPMTAGLPEGSYVFTAIATDNTGATTTSAPVAITVSTTASTINNLYIESPGDTGRVSAPTEVTGVIATPGLSSWTLQYRLRPDGDDTAGSTEPWLSAATGTASVGTPATGTVAAVPGVIGTFDPTRLINGIYELRLSAVGNTSSSVTSPITVIVDGNMKVGAFTLAFEDLKLPVAGVPISVTRTYDSRDTRVGDFGPGWRIAINNVRVQKNRNLGRDWYQTPQFGSGIQFYNVDPIGDRIVTITMPDGESHRFRAGALVKKRPGDPDNASFAVVNFDGRYKFYPLGDTTSALEPINAAGELDDHFWIHGTGDQDLRTADASDPFASTYNPTRFRLTTKEGTKFIVDEMLGLLRLEDLTSNTLVLNRDAQNRVNQIVSTQAAPSGPLVTAITIHRDAIGRVDYIRDPAGKDLDYTYDAAGRLESFANRELNTTQFRYENSAFPYYLTKIIDPRGVTALRSEFDADGKLIKQIDADGRETVFDRGIDVTGRFEKVTDRLGHTSTFYYDDRGNVTTKLDPLNARTTFAYYPDSDWVKFETDHYGNTKSMAYDARGNVTVQTVGASLTDDPANPVTGYTTRTVYNALGAPTQITDPAGRVQSFEYDPVTNNLLSNTVGVGGSAPATTTYHYNSDGTLDTITDALGNVTKHTYNYAFTSAAYPSAVKQITATVKDPASTVLRTSRTVYDAQENMLEQIATRTLSTGGTEDIVTSYVYDAENRLEATIMPDGKVSETRYTSFGQTDKSLLWKSTADFLTGTETLARVTSYGYDNRGNQTSTTYVDGTSESSSFDLEGRREWSQDKLGRKTHFRYDDVGRLRFTILPDDTPDDLTNNPYTETVYDLTGRVTDTYDELRHRSTVAYYPDGTADAGRRKQSIQVLSTGNLITGYQYDASGNVRFVTDPRGNTTETQYDDQGRPKTVIYPATDEHPATQSTTTYDLLGRRLATTDQEGRITRYRYDGLGRLVEVRQYLDQSLAASDANFQLPATDASVVSTRYTHDEVGNQLTQTDARGNSTSYRYDSLGRRTHRILPDNATESLQYDEWGNLWKRTDFKGYTTTFLYDTLNRLTEKSADPAHPSLVYSHAPDKISFGYDAAGNRTDALMEKGSTVLFTEDTPLDERGRRHYKDTALGRLTYGYYANSLLKSIDSSNADGTKLAYRYDDANRLAYVDDSSQLPAGATTPRTTAYAYNTNGSLETVTAPNNVIQTYAYDALNRLRTLNVTRGATLVHAYEYKLRASGHRQQIVEGSKTTTFTYDDLYRLTSETVAGGLAAQNGIVSYGLDKVGNRESRLSSIPSIGSIASTFNSRDWLSGDTYDANGNTLTSPISVYGSPLSTPDVYDFEDRLIIRRKPDGSSVNLSYDADGILRQKTVLSASGTLVSATGYLTDGQNPTGYAQVVEERVNTAAGTTIKTYAYGSDLISRTMAVASSSPQTAYFLYDGLGSVRELTNEFGAVTDSYTYDAFGILTDRTGISDNPYLYRGERFESDVGQYFLRARFYNQATGRFWNEDTYEGSASDPMSLHKYSYANANPIGAWDPSGNSWLGDVITSVAVRGMLTVMTYPKIFLAIGLVVNLVIPDELDLALQSTGIPGFQGLSTVRRGEVKLLNFLKNKWISSSLTNSLRGLLSNKVGNAFEEFVFKTMFRNAERQIKTGKRIADGLWRGRLIEVKTGAIDLGQLKEFAAYAKENEIALTYVFLSSPSQATIDAIEDVGGTVVSFF